MGFHHVQRSTFSLGPFQLFGFLLCFVWWGLFFPVSVLIVLGAGGVLGAPAQGSGAGQWCQAHEPKPAAYGSDLLADGKGYPCWNTAPCWLGSPRAKRALLVKCWVSQVGQTVCMAPSAAAGEATHEGLCGEKSVPATGLCCQEAIPFLYLWKAWVP